MIIIIISIIIIIINDRLSSKACLERRERQGNPLSPLLYVLCVEVLACLICRSPEIEGFVLPGANGLQARDPYPF